MTHHLNFSQGELVTVMEMLLMHLTLFHISTDAFFCSDAYEITRPASTGTTTNEPQSQTIFFIDA
jgi:hypothetical protein